MKKFSSSLLSLALSFLLVMPLRVAAQEETPAPPTVEESVVATSEFEPSNPPVIRPIPVTLRDTSVQGSIESGLLEETENPQESSGLEKAIKVIDTATEEREITSIEETDEEVIEVPPTEEEIVEVIELETEEVAELEMAILIPTREYTFEIDGGAIATKETPEWSEAQEGKIGENKEVTQAPALSVDTHALNISGLCSDPYYVILVYRNAGDYDRDPASYIFNRAFLCQNGQYSYSLSDLPFNLESGTFYLLVGGQGSKGSWKPISALTPIGITVKTVMVKASSTPDEQ